MDELTRLHEKRPPQSQPRQPGREAEMQPRPIWTPLIPATFSPAHVKEFGSGTLMGRAGQPSEVAPAYVFLASEDASYFTGQVLHPNGGDVMT